jgi:hypothetical protein
MITSNGRKSARWHILRDISRLAIDDIVTYILRQHVLPKIAHCLSIVANKPPAGRFHVCSVYNTQVFCLPGPQGL